MIAVVCVVVSVQQTMLFPVLPELPDKLGASPVAVSWLVTSTAFCGAILTPAVAREFEGLSTIVVERLDRPPVIAP